MTEFRFTKEQHLRSKADFERVYARRCKLADGTILLFALLNNLPLTRIGLSVSKKHGCAIVRNRLKRLLREAFRLKQHEIPSGLDLVAVPLSKENASLLTYQKSLVKLANGLVRRLRRDTPVNEVPQ